MRTEISEICQNLSAKQYSLYRDTKSHEISQSQAMSKSLFYVTKSGILTELSILSDGLVFLFNDSTRFPANFETDFLTKVTNKSNFNEYLAH